MIAARFFRPFGTWLAFGMESQGWNIVSG